MKSLMTIFLLFIIYSFLGWIIETIYTTARDRRLVNRGFLIGPICPIYGCGALLMVAILSNYLTNPFLLFIMSILIFSILEYSTSFFMEKIFKARWWDYSDRKFNINGRVCLATMLPFGVLGVICLYFIHPFFMSILNMLPFVVLAIISCIVFVIFISDFIISLVILNKYKNTIKKISKDNTEEISIKARQKFLEGNLFKRRLMRAFPGVVTSYDHLKKLQKDINKQLDKMSKK